MPGFTTDQSLSINGVSCGIYVGPEGTDGGIREQYSETGGPAATGAAAFESPVVLPAVGVCAAAGLRCAAVAFSAGACRAAGSSRPCMCTQGIRSESAVSSSSTFTPVSYRPDRTLPATLFPCRGCVFVSFFCWIDDEGKFNFCIWGHLIGPQKNRYLHQ